MVYVRKTKRKYKDAEYKGEVLTITVQTHNRILEMLKDEHVNKMVAVQKKLYEREQEIKQLKLEQEIKSKSGKLGKKSGSRKRIRNVE
jgi:hypothetical protein